MNDTAPITLPPALVDNPRLDQWVRFTRPGRIAVATGKVEIGQGILTAMLQIAAEELDIAPERIDLESGDTGLTPNEGYTSGSQSIQYGGVALRLACAEVRRLLLDRAADVLGCPADELAIQNAVVIRNGQPSGQDYWSLAPGIDLTRRATGSARPKVARQHHIVGRNAPRVDLVAKVFGEEAFVHDMQMPGMLHARVVRQPRREATIAAVDEAAIRRAAKGDIEILRNGNFLAITGPDETVVEAVAAVAPNYVTWDGVDPINPQQEEARSLLQQPSIDRVLGAPLEQAPTGARRELTVSRMNIAHASIGPSCSMALYQDGQMQIWTHSQGVYPLREAVARTLKLDAAKVSVRHVQGPGCYGHNGADDAAADAAVIAYHNPGKPVRVRWRREEEFGYEPVSSAMVVTVSAALDADGKPTDWTTEIWSGKHVGRPGRGNAVLAEEALPNPPSPPPVADPPEAGGGGGTRNGEPLYAFPAKRMVHHLITESPVRLSSLRGLGATTNVFAIEGFMDELADAAGQDPVTYRLSVMADPRARAVIEHVARMSGWQPGLPAGTGAGKGRGIAFAQYKNRAAYCAVVADVEVDESVRVERVWCAADAGLVINPDGAISWALKEGVRLDQGGISSLDWETYPVLRFSEVPEVTAELVGAAEDNPPLGIGEAAGGPTAAAIGNAVARALGTRIRDMPMTRERVMAALLRS